MFSRIHVGLIIKISIVHKIDLDRLILFSTLLLQKINWFRKYLQILLLMLYKFK